MNKSPFKTTPFKFVDPITLGLVAGGVGAIGQTISSFMGRGDRIREQKAAEAENRRMMQEYRDLDTSNIYGQVRNPYENIETEFENVYEDLTVNQQQAQFEKQMAQQQQANIMQNLQGAAGGSGIAGLARAMEQQALRTRMAGAAQAQEMRLQGEETSRALEYQKTSTLLGMSQQRLAAANLARQQARENQMAAFGSLAGVGVEAIKTGQ